MAIHQRCRIVNRLRERLLNMCVIVFFPPFPRCERECRVALGVPGRGDWSVSHSCHTEPQCAPNPRPRPLRAEEPGPGLGAAGVLQAFSSSSSHPHKGDRDHAGSLLRKGWAKTWQNGLIEARIHTHTHMLFWGLSVLPVGMVGKIWSRRKRKIKDK